MIICRVCKNELSEDCFFPSSIKKSDFICKECSKKRSMKYKTEHPEQVKAVAKRTRDKHKEEIKQRNKEYYERTKNDPAHIKARRASYEKGKNKWHENDRLRRRAFNEKYKSKCAKCGEDRVYLIQFHHIDPATKLFSIGANATSKSEAELKQEIAKCVCLCSNCHDEFHYFYGANPKNPKSALDEYLRANTNG